MADVDLPLAELAAVTANAPDFILLLDRDGTIRFINRTLPPWTRGDVIGRSWIDFAQPWERARIAAVLDEVITTGRGAVIEQAGYGAEATTSWYGSHLGPVIRDGVVTGVVVIARDITAQRERETRLRVADRLATVGTLVGGVAHGINNPLSAVVANLAIARRAAAGLPADHPVRAALDAALRDAGDAALRIGDVVGDLNVFARAEAPHTAAMDVRDVLDATIHLAWNELRHRARLARHFEDVPLVEGNRGKLGQVFLNLLVNAIQATPEGRADRHVIEVGARHVEGAVEVWLTDTGVGMDEATQARLFTPFFTTHAAGESAGLGLAISQRIVADHGGTIAVTSAPGAGTTVRVRLPALAVRAAPRTPAPPVIQPSRSRILVIDDEELVTSAIARILETHHDVITENRAAAAIERLAVGERFDLILCDVMMPELTGVDVLDAIEALAPEQLPRLTFMTGGAFTPRARALLDDAAHPVLTKPFSVEDLFALVAARLAG